MTEQRVATIERVLRDALAPQELMVKDQSHLHAGHEGAKEGKGHFEVTIVSDQFSGANRIARHRMVYDALGTFMDSDIHALRIYAYSPSERSARLRQQDIQ
jgi:BolA protein